MIRKMFYILMMSVIVISCENLDDDPCTFQKGEKVTVTSRFDDFADHFRITRECSENSIVEISSATVYLVIKDSKIYTKKGDKITLEIIEKTYDFSPIWKHAYYVKVVAHKERF